MNHIVDRPVIGWVCPFAVPMIALH